MNNPYNILAIDHGNHSIKTPIPCSLRACAHTALPRSLRNSILPTANATGCERGMYPPIHPTRRKRRT